MTATPTRTATRQPVRREVAVAGVRFSVRRIDPPRKRRTTPVLLLHGVPETSRMWEPLLADLGRDRIAFAPDLKGLGASEVRGPYDVNTLVRELVALALHEVDGQIDIVGHDWGGSLGLMLAATRPELVRRLVVINAPYRNVDLSRAWHMPFFALPAVPEGVFMLGGRSLVGRMLDYGWRSPRVLEEDVRKEYVDAYSDPARVRAMLAYYRGVVRPRLAGMARRAVRTALRQPVPTRPAPRAHPESALVIWGAADPVLPVRVGESVVEDLGPDARFVTLPGVGHFSVDEAPEQVTALVGEFLRRGEAAKARSAG